MTGAFHCILNWFCFDGAAFPAYFFRFGTTLLADLWTGREVWLRPICFAVAWLFIGSLISNLFHLMRDGKQRLKTLHQIPCAKCQYFTNDMHLKCTVHPMIALSEDAINCADFEGCHCDRSANSLQ
ncbi:MAG: hypothetical protein AAGA67_09270 [Cyanobacteria bacterium P01_F01_bin.153]